MKLPSGETLRNALAATLLSIITLIAFLMIWSVAKAPDFQYQHLPWDIASESKSFKAGQTVPLRVHRCNYSKHTILYEVTRGVKNTDTNITTTLSSTKVMVEPGCHETISYLHVLPNDIEPGNYIIVGVAVVPDLVAEKHVPFSSKPFRIVTS